MQAEHLVNEVNEVILNSLLDHFAVILGSFWGHLGIDYADGTYHHAPPTHLRWMAPLHKEKYALCDLCAQRIVRVLLHDVSRCFVMSGTTVNSMPGSTNDHFTTISLHGNRPFNYLPCSFGEASFDAPGASTMPECFLLMLRANTYAFRARMGSR